MYTDNNTLYPMLGVGAFVTMFWVGVVAGYELGLSCASLLIMGLLSACIATVGVCELQRRDRLGMASEAGTRMPDRIAAGGSPDTPEAGRARRRPLNPLSMGGRRPVTPAGRI